MTQAPDDKLRIWDSYWQDSRTHSGSADISPEVEEALDKHWEQLAGDLPDGASVLDLGCGNGAVGLAVVRTAKNMGKTVKVTGIDAAAIDPPRFVTRHAELLKTITFHAHTRMEELPFEANTFDAVYCQFAIEFSDLNQSVPEVGRVLKPKGQVSILALPAVGEIVELAKKRMKQSDHLLNQTKLFDIALAVAQGLSKAESGNEARDTKAYLQRFNDEVERVINRFSKTDSDLVMAMIIGLQKVFTDRKTMDLPTQLAKITDIRKRLTDGAARAELLTRSALGDAGLNGLKRRLADVARLAVAEVKPFSVGTFGTVAWRIMAHK